MKTLIRIISLAMLVPTSVIAKSPKEVIITDSVPISVEVMSETPVAVSLEPGGFVNTAPIPAVPAKLTYFGLIADTAGGQEYIVERDSIIKYVNITFNNMLDTDANNKLHCSVSAVVEFPRHDDGSKGDRMTLGHISVFSASLENGGSANTGQQFLTGDILLPVGTIIEAKMAARTGDTCQAIVFGILFEQN